MNICPMRPALAKTEFEKNARASCLRGERTTGRFELFVDQALIEQAELVNEIILHEKDKGSDGKRRKLLGSLFRKNSDFCVKPQPFMVTEVRGAKAE